MLRVDHELQRVLVDIPLTRQTGKIRVKERNTFEDYGKPVATRQNSFSENHYIEWQIGYDVTEDRQAETTLSDWTFEGANTKIKYLYELSEIVYYLKQFGAILPEQIEELIDKLKSLDKSFFIENSLIISRDTFSTEKIAGLDFSSSYVNYPLAVYHFSDDLIAEIVIKEKQRAVGVQPMLYFCFPVTLLSSNTELIGREANKNECATFVIDANSANDYLKMIELFGILSSSHNHDVLEILNIILNN